APRCATSVYSLANGMEPCELPADRSDALQKSGLTIPRTVLAKENNSPTHGPGPPAAQQSRAASVPSEEGTVPDWTAPSPGASPRRRPCRGIHARAVTCAPVPGLRIRTVSTRKAGSSDLNLRTRRVPGPVHPLSPRLDGESVALKAAPHALPRRHAPKAQCCAAP